jgi:diacylglycerol kinase (ATP)
LGIPIDAKKAIEVLVHGINKKIHLTEVNGELCIHLADMGFNAFVIKKFDTYNARGMWGYVKAAWSVLRNHARMQVQIRVDGELKQKSAAMIVIANATKYGTGALINPDGSLEDELFEIIVVKKISFSEIFKMVVTHQPYDPQKTEVYQTNEVHITSKRKAHFQVDGEYLGKVNEVKATIVAAALEMIVPQG